MQIIQANFQNRAGHTLRGIVTLPDGGGVFPMLVMLHGFGGNLGGYKAVSTQMARALATQGIGSARFDYYGNGESDGSFADMTFDGLHTDIADIYAWVKAQPFTDNDRVFLCGHSMGGYLAASTAPKLNPRGLVLLCPGAAMWYGCAERADAVTKTGQDYADIEGLCYKMDFNYQMAKHPDPYTEAAGYNGPVFIARAADDKLVDDACCQNYKKVYRCAEVMTLERGGHNFAAIPTREALNHALAGFIKNNI